MVVEAYILLRMKTDKETYGTPRSTIEKLRIINGVETAELMFGDYDAILKLQTKKIHDIENLVLEEIRMLEAVESSITLLCVNENILIEEE